MACRTKPSAALAGWWLSCAVIIPATRCSLRKDGAKAQDGGQVPKRGFRAYQQDFGRTLEIIWRPLAGQDPNPPTDAASRFGRIQKLFFRLMHPGERLFLFCFGNSHLLPHHSTSRNFTLRLASKICYCFRSRAPFGTILKGGPVNCNWRPLPDLRFSRALAL